MPFFRLSPRNRAPWSAPPRHTLQMPPVARLKMHPTPSHPLKKRKAASLSGKPPMAKVKPVRNANNVLPGQQRRSQSYDDSTSKRIPLWWYVEKYLRPICPHSLPISLSFNILHLGKVFKPKCINTYHEILIKKDLRHSASRRSPVHGPNRLL